MVIYNYDYDLFLSYASPDLRWVKKLAKQLREDGFAVFFDEWTIEPGEHIYLKICEGLNASYKTIFVASRSSVDPERQWPEFERAFVQSADLLGKGTRLISLLRENCDIPTSLSKIKYIDFRKGRFKDNYKKLIEQIKRIDSMRLGPFELEETNIRRVFESITDKARLFFDFPQNRLDVFGFAFDELTSNAFKYGASPIQTTVYADWHGLKLEVQDVGPGFDIAEQNRTTNDRIKNEPGKKGKRGIWGVYNICDGLSNSHNGETHTITVDIDRQRRAKAFPSLEEWQESSASPYAHLVDTHSRTLLLKINMKEINTDNCGELASNLEHLRLKYDFDFFILDLGNVGYITSAGWGEIVASAIFSDEAKQKAIILAPDSPTARIFYEVWWDMYESAENFHVFEGVRDALDFFQF